MKEKIKSEDDWMMAYCRRGGAETCSYGRKKREGSNRAVEQDQQRMEGT